MKIAATLALFVATLLSNISLAVEREGDDYLKECKDVYKTVPDYYHGEAVCNATTWSSSGGVTSSYPVTLRQYYSYSSVKQVQLFGSGTSCLAWLPNTVWKTVVEQECKMVPRQPYVIVEAIDQYCNGSYKQAYVVWNRVAGQSYEFQRSINDGQFSTFNQNNGGPIVVSPGSFNTYRLRSTQDGKVGSWSYVTVHNNAGSACRGSTPRQ